MSVRLMAALVAIATGFAPANAAAQTAASFVDPVAGLSLDDAIAGALAREPSLRAARTTVDVARGMRLQAERRPNPTVSTELRGEPAGSDNQTMVTVEWPLDLFRRRGRIAVADREVTAVEHAVADRERSLRAEVRTRFGEALVVVRDLTVLDELVDVSRRQLELLRSRVESGASPPLERDLVDVEVRRLNAERSLLLGRVERAMYELRRVVGLSPGDPLRLRDTLEDVVSREPVAALGATEDGERRPDVREAQARVAVADAKIDRARLDGRADVTIFAGYTRMDSGFAQFGLTPSGTPERIRGVFTYVSGGAMVMLPIFNRNQGEIAAARAERAGAVAMLEATALSASAEIAAARALDRRAHEAVRVYAADARTLARQNLSIVRQSQELGRTTVSDVLAEQRRYLDFERGYTETLRAAFEARTALNRALGESR